MLLRKNTIVPGICIAFLAACSSSSDDPISENKREDLDMREANVLAVEYDAAQARFDVTLIHADDDESGYADWWQVETLDGNLLGRRELAHAHGNVAFTRSHFITVPAGIDYVVVRGHDQSHGYGGQAIVFELSTGIQDKIKQGSEPVDFSNYPNMATQ
jgi:hypothetical protein